MAKIIHMTSVHPVEDGRIFHKQCRSLAEAGHEVVLVGVTDSTYISHGVKILGVPRAANRFERMTRTVWNVFWEALQEKGDIYHFHDPELLPIGILLRFLGKKVVFDIHEDVPKQILVKEWLKWKLSRKLLAKIYILFEKIGVMFMSAVVTVTPQIANRLPSNKTFLVRNFVNLSLIDSVMPVSILKEKYVVIYHGSLHTTRGIKEMIQAMQYLKGKAELWIFGRWPDEQLRRECELLSGWEHTVYKGFKPLEEVYSFLKCADVGLHMVHDIPNNEGGYPVKCFEYMACRIPFVVTKMPAKVAIFEGCALFAESIDPGVIGGKILELLDNKELRLQLGANGRIAVENKYSWELEKKTLLSLYQKYL